MYFADEEIIQKIAEEEDVPAISLLENIASGKTIVLYSTKGKFKPLAIGAGVSTKTNANIGVYISKNGYTRQELKDIIDKAIEYELEKLKVATECGIHTVMDLSNGEGIKGIRKAILTHSSVPVGTVPLYEMARNVVHENRSIDDITLDDILKVIEEQAKEGVSYMTIHCAVLREGAELAQNRIGGIVSRGGHLMDVWMQKNRKENPLYVHFDDILTILKEYSVALSIGDGLRPGATHDASDPAQLHELYVASELVQRARSYGVQVMVEGPGHVPLYKIKETMKEEKEICHGAPFYVLGPLIIDNGAGYDHIVGGIGAALAARYRKYGADFLCYVTPSEHLHSPTVDDVKRGADAIVKAAEAADKRLAINSILNVFNKIENRDIVSEIYNEAVDLSEPGSKEDILERNNTISKLRKKLIWSEQRKYALFPEIIEDTIKKYKLVDREPCNMCGDQCAIN